MLAHLKIPLNRCFMKTLTPGKLGGVFTVKPSSGPHKQGESLPVGLFLRWQTVFFSSLNALQWWLFEYLLFDEHENNHPPLLMCHHNFNNNGPFLFQLLKDNCSGTAWSTPSPWRRLRPSWSSVWSRSMARLGLTLSSPPASWTSSRSTRLARTSGSSTTWRDASPSTGSLPRRLPTSFAGWVCEPYFIMKFFDTLLRSLHPSMVKAWVISVWQQYTCIAHPWQETNLDSIQIFSLAPLMCFADTLLNFCCFAFHCTIWISWSFHP